MEKHKVFVGSHGSNFSGFPYDNRKPVTLNAELLAEFKAPDYDQNSGVVEKLFRLDDDRLVVHQHCWSCWQGSGSSDLLLEVSESDLQYGKRFQDLGFEAGFWSEIPLAAALADAKEMDEGADFWG